MSSGSIYTVTGVTDPARNGSAAVITVQGTVAIGQWGFFLPSEYQSAVEDGFILASGISGGAQQAPSTGAAAPSGALSGTLVASKYRSTQVQAYLSTASSGQWLFALQTSAPYLFTPGQDMTYPLKTGYTKEIPFVDTLSIARALGGWDSQTGTSGFTRTALDYAQGVPGSLTYQTSMLTGRLASYLAAGYPPSSITISIDNIGWAMAASNSFSTTVNGNQTISTTPANLAVVSTTGAPTGGGCVTVVGATNQLVLFSGVSGNNLTNAQVSSGSFNVLNGAAVQGIGNTGVWGQNNPHDNDTDLTNTLKQAATDLVNYIVGLGYSSSVAAQVRWKICVEFDSKPSFNGTAAQYYDLYNTAYVAIRSIIPTAVVMPAEFTDNWNGTTGVGNCVFNNADFLAQAATAGTTPTVLPRSLNQYLSNNATSFPANTISSMLNSYAGVTQRAEVHQFGLLGLPSPWVNAGSDQGAVQANWQFQVMMGIRAQMDPDRINGWQILDGPTATPLLNGIGYVRFLFTRYDGALIYQLMNQTINNTSFGVYGFFNIGTAARSIIISSYAPPAATSPTPSTSSSIQFTVPSGFLVGNSLAGWKITRYGPGLTVHDAVKTDLSLLFNLAANYAVYDGTMDNSIYTDTVGNMALSGSGSTLNNMLSSNWTSGAGRPGSDKRSYQQVIQSYLNLAGLRTPSDGISYDGVSQMSATVPANQMIVLEYGRP